MFVIFTDTDTDITPKMAEEYGYKLISMPYTIGEKTTYPYVDFKEFDAHKFYDTLRGGVLPTTSAINPEEYKAYFEPYFKNGDEVLYVHFSKAMSGTFNALNIAMEDLKEEYPDAKFHMIDTKGITITALAVVIEIGKLYKAGKTYEEIQAWADKEIDHFACYFFADDLKFFRKSGRVSGFAGLMGNLVGIKPIITMNDEGMMASIGKERGRGNAIAKLVEYVKTLGDGINNYTFILGHADNIELVNKLKEELEKAVGEIHPIIVDVNPTAGSHCGPDTIGVCFHAIHK